MTLYMISRLTNEETARISWNNARAQKNTSLQVITWRLVSFFPQYPVLDVSVMKYPKLYDL